MSRLTEDEIYLSETQNIAIQSTCLRAKCGCIIVLDNQIIATGFNEPPQGDLHNRICTIDFPVHNRRKPKADCTCCIHAEENAIIAALKTGKNLKGSTLYFIRVDEHGKQKPSGEPYCIKCSKLALHCGISYWVLLHKNGPRTYTAKEYHQLSVTYHLKTKE